MNQKQNGENIMGKNKRRFTKIKLGENEGDIIIKRGDDFEVENKGTELSHLKELYVIKHFKIKDKVLRDKSFKVKLYSLNNDEMEKVLLQQSESGVDYYVKISNEAHSKQSEYLLRYNYTTLVWQKKYEMKLNRRCKKVKGNFKKISDTELMLLKSRAKLAVMINKNVKGIFDSYEYNEDLISYDEDLIYSFAQELIDFRNKHGKNLTDDHSKSLEQIMLVYATKGGFAEELIRYICYVFSSDVDDESVKSKLDYIIWERPNKVVRSIFSTSISSNVGTISSLKFSDLSYKQYEEIVDEYVQRFDVVRLVHDFKKCKDKTHFQLKLVLSKHYHDVISVITENESSKLSPVDCYFMKHINRYMKGRINKVVCKPAYLTNGIFDEVFETSKIEAKLKNSLLNKYRYYKINHHGKEDLNTFERQLSKANRTFRNKLVTKATELVHTQLSLSEIDFFEIKKVSGYSIYADTIVNKIDKSNRENMLKTFRSDSILYHGQTHALSDDLVINYIIGSALGVRNLLFHHINGSEAKQGNNIFPFTDVFFASVLSHVKTIDLKSVSKKILTERLETDFIANNVYSCFDKSIIMDVLDKVTFPITKSAILPRFSKVYSRLVLNDNVKVLLEQNIDIEDDVKIKIEGARQYILNLLYKESFYNWLCDNLESRLESTQFIKLDSEIAIYKHITLEGIKQQLMSMTVGDEDKMRKQENKFIDFVSEAFNHYLDELDLCDEIFSISKYDKDRSYAIDNNLKYKDLNIKLESRLSASLVFISNMMRNRNLNHMINDLQKYKQFLLSFDLSFCEKIVPLMSIEEISSLTNILEIQLVIKEKNLSQQLTADSEQARLLAKLHFELLNFNCEFKEHSDLKYSINDKSQCIISEETTNEQSTNIVYKQLLDISKFGYLQHTKDIFIGVLRDQDNFSILEILKSFGEYKSDNKIADLIKMKDKRFKKLKSEYFKLLTKKFVTKEEKVNFVEIYNELLELNKEILDYQFYSNILFLNTYTKTISFITDLSSRIIVYMNLIERVNMMETLPSVHTNKLHKNIRHLNHVSNYSSQGSADFVIDQVTGISRTSDSLNSSLEFLTNFRNDVPKVFINLLAKYNFTITFEQDGSYHLAPKCHRMFNRENIKERLDIEVKEDLLLVSIQETKLFQTLLSKKFK